MSDAYVSGGVSDADRIRRLDLAVTVVIWALLLGLVGLGGVFFMTYQANQRAEGSSSPAQRALRGLEQLVKQNPNSAAARVRLGEAYAAAGLEKQAVANLKAAIKLDSKHTGAYLDLGMIAMGQNEPKAAKGYFQKVLELTATDDMEGVNQRREQAYFYLGQIAVGQKDWETAIENLKAALRIKKDSSDAYYFIAVAYRGLEDENNAKKSLDIALAFDPNYAAAHYELGKLYKDQGHEASAAVEFREALKLNPKGYQAREALKKLGPAGPAAKRAVDAFKAGNLAEAEKQALLATAIDPDDVSTHLLYARVLEQMGDKKGALNRYERVKELDPNNAEVAQAIKRLGG